MKFPIMKLAIINTETKEFYPDPLYTDFVKITKKIEYLKNYRIEHGMDQVDYGFEELTPEREAQHNKEWNRWVSMID